MFIFELAIDVELRIHLLSCKHCKLHSRLRDVHTCTCRLQDVIQVFLTLHRTDFYFENQFRKITKLQTVCVNKKNEIIEEV